MNTQPIGIFDSGVGGLTVFSEIKKELPNENLLYIGDTKNFPYGPKTKEEVIKYAIQNTEFLLSQNVKVIIIACGTATSHALKTLQNKYSIPIIGIIDPTISYIKSLNLKEIGVIGTEGTIKSGSWEKALKNACPEIEVVNKACPLLAEIAEEGKAKSAESRKIIKEYMIPFKSKKINNIILGCTHYPIYQQIIKDELQYDVNLINTGKTISYFLKDFLFEHKLINLESNPKYTIFLSKYEQEFENISSSILKFNVKKYLKYIDI